MPEIIGYEYELEDTIRIPESQLSDFLEDENVISYAIVDDYDLPSDDIDEDEDDNE